MAGVKIAVHNVGMPSQGSRQPAAPGDSFGRRVLVLATGLGAAQAIVIAAAPALSRLYAPEEIGVLAGFASLVSVAVVGSSWGYQLAIPLPERPREAGALLLLAVAANLLTTLLLLAILLAFGAPIAGWIGHPFLDRHPWLFCGSVLGAGSFIALSYWALRQQAVRELAGTKIYQALASVGIQIGSGVAGFGTTGLLVGDAVGRFAGSGRLFQQTVRPAWPHLKAIRARDVRAIAGQYRKFPTITMPASMLNAAGSHLVPILLLSTYGAGVAGLFSLAQRVAAAPVGLFAKSAADAFMAEAPRLARDLPTFRRNYLRRLRKLALLGLAPAAALFALGPSVFPWLFGDAWADSGHYARILSPMLWLQFAVAPLTSATTILERQELQIVWDAARSVLVLAAIAAPAHLGYAAPEALIAYTAVVSVAYVAHVLLCLWITRSTREIADAAG